MRVKSIIGGLVAASIASTASASQDPAAPALGPHDVTSAFFISKSENANQVHYGVRLDSQCNIDGTRPVYAYWRMREGGSSPHAEGLLRREQSAYGIASQAVTGNTIRVTLRAIPDRPIDLRVLRTDSGCRVMATTAIARHGSAHLEHIHVQLAWPAGVRHLDLVGVDSAGVPTHERIAR